MQKIINLFKDDDKSTIVFLILSALSLILSFLHIFDFIIDIAWIAIILCGVPIVKDAIEWLITEFDIKADVLAAIALVSDDIKAIPHLLSLSRKTMNIIKWNLSLSMLLNFVAIILAMTGILNPVLGALVHNLGSVAVIINSALLLNFKSR